MSYENVSYCSHTYTLPATNVGKQIDFVTVNSLFKKIIVYYSTTNFWSEWYLPTMFLFKGKYLGRCSSWDLPEINNKRVLFISMYVQWSLHSKAKFSFPLIIQELPNILP